MAVILDCVTPLAAPALPVDGNAAHWAIRTAEAALTLTQVNWLATFDSQDQWNALDAGPALTAWTPYVNPQFRSRKGRSASRIHIRMGRHFVASWEKAVRHWNLNFRDDGEHFYPKLIDAQESYANATRRFLGLVGLRSQHFLGAFATHLLALCGSEDLLDIGQGWTIFYQLNYPAPPIIPTSLRRAAATGLLGLLNRDVYFLLMGDTDVVPNAQLDTVLAGVLGFDYAGPPASYIHVEGSPGAYSLHTHIEGTPAHRAPQVLDFHRPMPAFTGTGLRAVVMDDLYAQIIPGDRPIASAVLRLDTITGDVAQAELLLVRSDLPGSPVALSPRRGEALILDVLPEGVRWQLVALSGTLPQPVPQVGYQGRLWAFDDLGHESNHAFWSVSGNILHVSPWNIIHTFPFTSAGFLELDTDIFRHASTGLVPIVSCHITWDGRFPWLFPIQVNLHVSTDTGQGFTIPTPGDTAYEFPVPPPGGTLDLRILAFGTLQAFLPIILTGSFWVTDAHSVESRHVRWRAFIFSREDPTP